MALHISHHTVCKHRSNILEKLDLHSSAQLLAYAMELHRTPTVASSTAIALAEMRPREQQVVRLIAQGLTGKQVARQLGISPGTVRKHRDNLARRTGLRTIADIIAWVTRSAGA